VAVCALATAVVARAEEAPALSANEESLYQQFSRAIVRLEEPDKHRSLGTGFFVHQKADGDTYFLVTARHVVDPRVDLRARVPTQRIDDGKTDVVELRIPKDAWVYHPAGERTVEFRGKSEKLGAVDVAVAKIPPLQDRRVRAVSYCSGVCPEGVAQQFLDGDALPPAQVLVWGFPGNLGFLLTEQRPMARLGVIAMVAEEPFVRTENELRDERVLLIDAPSFGGNSGGPVFTYPRAGPMRLAGLISAMNRSLAYAIAEPVSRIAEALQTAHESTERNAASWEEMNRQ
jgi:S1-C subfamily serine protease